MFPSGSCIRVPDEVIEAIQNINIINICLHKLLTFYDANISGQHFAASINNQWINS